MNPTGPEHLKFWTERLEEFWPCFVYVTRAGGPIKVGMAHNVMGRLSTLQTGNPYRFELLYVFPGAHDLEWQLHRRIKDNKTDGGEEWFDGDLVPDFLEFVDDLALKMVAAYAGDGAAPHWKGLMERWVYRRPRGPRHAEVTVRHVEPNPLSPEEVAARIEKQAKARIRNGEKLHHYAKPREAA